MIEIFNSLKPFFEDCYLKFGIRDYARLIGISPPSASTLLNYYNSEGLINKEHERIYHLFSANRENWLFNEFSRIYWRQKLEKIGLLKQISKDYKLAKVILFGSLTKSEITLSSDIDIAIISPTEKRINYNIFEKKLNRKIQIFRFSSEKDIKNKELLNNIIKGYVLFGD